MSEKPVGLVAALAQVQANMPTVHKGQTARVPTKAGGSYSYDYADLADVAKAIYPLLSKSGLAFICAPQFVGDRYVLAAALEHEGGETREAAFPLSERATPQELGSALTYGRRYLLGCLTGVVTEKDDDGAAASTARPAQPRKRQQPPEPAATDDADTARAELRQLCEDNGWDRTEIAAEFANANDGIEVKVASPRLIRDFIAAKSDTPQQTARETETA